MMEKVAAKKINLLTAAFRSARPVVNDSERLAKKPARKPLKYGRGVSGWENGAFLDNMGLC
jgi:hypothetical protein